MAIMLTLFPAMVWADGLTEVYTECTSGNNSHTGNGTKENPYNLFEDALAAVADGGTIYIGEKGAFVNDESDGLPLHITKNVTIASAPDADARPYLCVRKGGIVLGADVAFSNIVVSLPNANHAAIFTNGYTLTLNNTCHDDSARDVHLVGGSLYSIDGNTLSPAVGEHSKIIISGSYTRFANIYAGSINGSFDKDVDITINGVSGSKLGSIYASGAKEGYYNAENFLDPYNEPEAPVADSAKYPVSGDVSLELNDSNIHLLDGATGGSNASLTVSTTYHYQPNLDNIKNLTVKRGTLAPTSLNTDVNVSVTEDAVLDMSSLADCAVNDFIGGGTLVLSKGGCLTINGTCTGTTKFKTDGTGIAEYDHLYIRTTGNGIFNFTPYSTQTDMTLDKCDDGWRTSIRAELGIPVLTAFDIDTKAVIATKSHINGKGGQTPMIPVVAEFTEETSIADIGMVPLRYTVTYNGATIGPTASAELTDCEGYYECDITELSMNFAPVEDTITVSNLSTDYGMLGEIATGIYDIEITAPTSTGDVTRSLHLTVIEDETCGNVQTQTNISISKASISYNDYISVSADIKADGQSVTNGNVTLYINGKPYLNAVTANENGSAAWNDIPVTSDNGFEIGSNQLTVRYNGSDDYDVSDISKELTVNKAVVTIQHSGKDTTVDYNGKCREIPFGVFSLKDKNDREIVADVMAEISYTDEAGNSANPIMPGIYTACLSVSEGDCYYAVTNQTGPKLTINPASPSVILNVTDKNECDVKLTAEVSGPIGGHIPTGTIKIINNKDGEARETASLNGGSAHVQLTNLTPGEHTFYAVYIPDGEKAPYISAASGDVSIKVDEPVAEVMFTVIGLGTDNIDVTFKNLTENDINNAVMIAAAYNDGGVLQGLVRANESVSAVRGETKQLSFDMRGNSYSKIKVFVWNSLEEMIPACDNYKSWE